MRTYPAAVKSRARPGLRRHGLIRRGLEALRQFRVVVLELSCGDAFDDGGAGGGVNVVG